MPAATRSPDRGPAPARRLARAALRRAAATAGPHLPDRAISRIVAARAWRQGLAVGLPRFDRVLVLAPHPDDESLAAGGTLARLADSGARITVVAATDGEASMSSPLTAADLAHVRRQELRSAAAVLGIADVRFLGHPDTGLRGARRDLGEQLTSLVEEIGPAVVILPWAGDDAGDHAALNLALADVGLPARIEVWGAEVWTPAPVNRLVDISAVVDRKRAAVAAHATAHGAFDLDAILGLNRYRSMRGLRGQGYAEGFLTCPGDRYADLVAAALDSTDP